MNRKSFDPTTFQIALWKNKQRQGDTSPHYNGNLKSDDQVICKIVAWEDKRPENNRPNINIRIDRSEFVTVNDRPEDKQGENVIDHVLVDTDRESRLDQMERDLETKLKKLEALEKYMEMVNTDDQQEAS